MDNFKKDYYQILGINPNATNKEIKSAYRSLARKYHPDVNPGNKLSEIKFKEVGEAYSILSNEKTRRQYNLLRGIKNNSAEEFYRNSQQNKKQASSAYSQEKPQSTPQQEPPKQQTPKKETAKNNANSDKKNFNNSFSDFLEGMFKKAKETETTAKSSTQYEYAKDAIKGDDITADISITAVEAVNGTIRKINVLHTQTCTLCRGRKIVNGYNCTTCDGSGEISIHKKLSVKIPPSVSEGSKIRIAREGNKGINGGENGDLFLVVHIQKNSIFTFEGVNVICEIPLTPSEAALGAEIQVPTIDGIANMKIPPETHSGQKFRLVGEGITDPNSNQKGDQLIVIRIEVPKNLTEKEKDLYKELSRIRKFNPRENIIYEN